VCMVSVSVDSAWALRVRPWAVWGCLGVPLL
jgi:hypothetical protein